MKSSYSAVGETELHHAAYHGHVHEIINRLHRGESVYDRDHQGRTVLSWAIRGRQQRVVRFLSAYYDRENAHLITFEDALDALRVGSKSMIESLVRMGFRINQARDEYGNTLLHWATFYNQPHTIMFLINRCGAKCRVHNKKHQTPYDIAILNQHYHLTFLFRTHIRRKSF